MKLWNYCSHGRKSDQSVRRLREKWKLSRSSKNLGFFPWLSIKLQHIFEKPPKICFNFFLAIEIIENFIMHESPKGIVYIRNHCQELGICRFKRYKKTAMMRRS